MKEFHFVVSVPYDEEMDLTDPEVIKGIIEDGLHDQGLESCGATVKIVTEVEEEDPELLVNNPIGCCPRCGAVVYTSEGFCGLCSPSPC